MIAAFGFVLWQDAEAEPMYLAHQRWRRSLIVAGILLYRRRGGQAASATSAARAR